MNPETLTASSPNSDFTGHHLIGLDWRVFPAGITSDWMSWKTSNILTHTPHIRYKKVETVSDTCVKGIHT